MKKNIGKRILSLALALVMVVGLLPMTAYANVLVNASAVNALCDTYKNCIYLTELTKDGVDKLPYVYYVDITGCTRNGNKVTFNFRCQRKSNSEGITVTGNFTITDADCNQAVNTTATYNSSSGTKATFTINRSAKSHTGGTATCIAKAKCSACGKEYGDYGDHSWGDWTTSNGRHIRTCTLNSTHTESGNCDHKAATCLAASACSVCKHVYAEKLEHNYTYTPKGNVLTEKCDNGCGHSKTATLQCKPDADLTYTGSAIEPMEMVYPEGWAGEKKQPADTDYEDNVNAGTNTASCSFTYADGATVSNTFTINPANLSYATVTLDPESGTYTGSVHNRPTYTLTYNGKELDEGTDYIVDANWSGDFTNVGSCNLILKGNDNFTGTKMLTYTIGKGTPTKEMFVVQWPENLDYDGTTTFPVTVTTTASGMGEFTVKYNGSEEVPVNAGTYTVTVDVAEGGNYNAVSGIELGSFTIGQANGAASASIADWVYGDAPNAPVVSSTNGTDNVTYLYKVKGADDSTYAATVPTQAGDYTVKASFPATTNYKAAEATADFTISKRPVTVKATDASKTYGDTDPELEWTVTSGTVLASDPLSVNISRVAGENAGDYTITVGQDEGANPNYDITFVNGTLTIHKASLTVIVKNQEIVYGDEIGEIIAGFDGFIDTTHYTTQLDFSNEVRTSTYKQYDDVGTYPITVSGITSNNYEITYVPGTLTVNPKPITVTIADKTGVYGEEVAELTAATDGIVNNDTNVYSLATTATSTANAGTYPITGTTLDNNYAITFVNGTYTITKAPVNSTGTDMTVSYTAGMEVDLRQMFTIDENAGEVDYWITHLTGDGSFTSAPYLYRIDKAGTFTVKITTEETANYNSGTATAVLTVNPGDPGIGAVTAAVVNDTLDTSAIVLTRENTDIDGNLTVDAGQTLAWGENTIRYTFTPTDGTNYKTVTGTVTVIVVDTVAPVGTVSIDDNQWNDLWNNITFGLFFKESKTVKVAVEDALSGIAKVEYYDSATALSADAVKAITAWTDMGADYAQDVTAEDTKTFIYYIRITDNAGNVTYISTADATYDLTKPVISGITNGSTYYTTQKVTVTDKNIDTITLNGEAATDAITLEGNKEATYTIVATDKAGNSTTVTVTMKPIKELAKATENLGNDNVTSADAPALEELVAKLDELIADPDTSDDGERETLEQHKVIAEALLKTIEDVAKATDTENTAKVEDVTADNVTPEDKSNLEDAKADLEDALENNGGNYTEEEKKAIKDEIQRIEDALEIVENVEAAEDAISDLPATVEPDDEETVAKIEEAKKIYGGLTDYEKSLVDEKVKEKLDKLTVAAVAYDIVKGDGGKWSEGTASGLSFTANGPISKFVSVEIDGKVIDAKYYSVKAGSTIITLNASYLETLSVGTHTITVVYSDGETEGTFKINPKSATPATGDNFNVLLWTSVMIVSLAAIAVLLIEQKKRRYVK